MHSAMSAAAVLVMLTAACGGGQSDGDSGDGGQATIKVWINGTEKDQGALMANLIPKFQQENPDIKVDTTLVDWATANQQILTAAAGGGLPDVLTFYSVDIPSFASQNLLLPLDKHIDPKPYVDAGVDLGTWDGSWVAAPWTLKVRSLAVRTDFAKEAGLDSAALPQTWDELRTWANDLTVRKGNNVSRSGFWVVTDHPYKTIQQFIPMLWSNGGRVFSKDGCKAAFQSPEGVETATFLSQLLNQDRVDFPGSVKADNTDLGQGKVAMLISNIPVRGWERDFPKLVEQKVVGFNPTPHTQGNKSYSEMGGNFLSVTKASKNPEAAAKFVEFMTTNQEAVTAANKLDQDVIPLEEASDWDYTKSHPTVQRLGAILQETGAGLPKHPKWAVVQNTLTAALSSIYLNGADPQKALADAASTVDGALQGQCAEETPNS
jgi:multiple sugar transport system substrate-binding protein